MSTCVPDGQLDSLASYCHYFQFEVDSCSQTKKTMIELVGHHSRRQRDYGESEKLFHSNDTEAMHVHHSGYQNRFLMRHGLQNLAMNYFSRGRKAPGRPSGRLGIAANTNKKR